MIKNNKNIHECCMFLEDENVKSNLVIYDQIKKRKTLSIKEISSAINFSENEVTKYVEKCAEAGLLKISNSGTKRIVEFNDEHRKILGISFHEEKCIITDIGLDGAIIAHEEIAIKSVKKLKGTNKELKEIVDRIKHHTKLRGTGISHIGIAFTERMLIKNAKAKEILGEGINRLFGCKIFTTKEATAFGYGEKDFGSDTQDKDILYMRSDVGMGTVIKKEMIYEPSDNIVDGNVYYLRPWEQFGMVKTA